jgi:ribosome-binding protein aMBF1 (putative translation factor)
MKTEQRRENGVVRRLTLNGKRVVVLEEAEFDRLVRRADEWEPAMPEPDERGLYPARETMAVIQARDIIRARRQLGLSQGELARLSGIRVETLNRENAKNKPNVATIEKIDRALRRASRKGQARHKAEE